MEYQFNEQELKARKKWLFATQLYYFVAPLVILLGLVCLLVIIYMLAIDDPEISSQELMTEIMLLLKGSIVSTIFYFIMIRCAYKNPGTKLLTCLLVTNFLGILRELIRSAKEQDPFMAAGALLFLGLYIFWVTRSFKLRAINKKVKLVRRKVSASTEQKSSTPPPVPALG